MVNVGGFVALHRQIKKSRMWTLAPGQFKAAITMLLMANFRPATWVCPRCREHVHVPRGGFVHSPKTISEEAGNDVSLQTVRRTIKRLCEWGTLTRPSERPRCHVCYAFVKYDEFNPGILTPTQQPTQPRPNPDPTPTTREQGEQGEQGEPTPPIVPPVPAQYVDTDLDYQEGGRTASLLRELCLSTGLPCRGFRDDLAWFQVKLEWARAFATEERRPGAMSQGEMRDHIRWAFSAPPFTGRNGEDVHWRDVVARHRHPPSVVIRNLPNWEARRAEARPKRPKRSDPPPLSFVSQPWLYDKPPGMTDEEFEEALKKQEGGNR
jgi:hypothetical protein